MSSQPLPIEEHALDNLRFIRDTMERASSFTAVPGWGGVAMGVTALGAAVIARRQSSVQDWLTVWIVEVALALLVGIGFTWRKAHTGRVPMWSAPARKFILGFAPPLVVGAVLTIALARANAHAILPGLWLCLYGTAVMTGGAFSARIVPAMGVAFACAGVGALFTPAGWSDFWLATGFGGMHVVFGILIARRYGG